MNIPDAAEKRYPERADDHAGRQEDRRMGFNAGAEWARKEALLEAADMAVDDLGDLDRYAEPDMHVSKWLRALAEEDN